MNVLLCGHVRISLHDSSVGTFSDPLSHHLIADRTAETLDDSPWYLPNAGSRPIVQCSRVIFKPINIREWLCSQLSMTTFVYCVISSHH